MTGEVVMGTGFLSTINASIADFSGGQSGEYADKISAAQEYAKNKMLDKVVNMSNVTGIVGVKFDYITFRNDMIGIIVNGTAVDIEKKED